MKHGNKTINYAIYDMRSNLMMPMGAISASGTLNNAPIASNSQNGASSARFITDTTSVTRPSLETLTESMKGAGIMGEIDLPTYGQLSAMTYSIAFKRSNRKAVSFFKQEAQHFETRWVTDVLDSANTSIGICSNKEIVKGFPKKLDLGSIETNSANEATVEIEVLYYKYIQDGEVRIEIDKLNNVFIIDGIDYMAQIREAL